MLLRPLEASNFLQHLSPGHQQRRHSSFQQQARYYSNSISDDSLNRSRRESFACMRASSPPVRRLSASCLQEELCALGHQLHIDPRYRDTRPIARSASSLYLANEHQSGGYYHQAPPSMAPSVTHFSPMRPLRRTPPPSIYIEEYQDEPAAKDSQESFGNFAAAYSDAHQPLNEEGIASMAHSDEIPFIDDEEEEKEKQQQQQQQQRPCMTSSTCSSSTVKRNPAASYRKTVSFDLDQTEEDDAAESVAGASGIDRKYHTHDAISHLAAGASSTESLMTEQQAERMPLIQKIRRELNSKRATNCSADGFSSGGSGSNSQRSSSESIERMPLLRHNPNQSPGQQHRQLNTQRSHKRSAGVGVVNPAAPIVSIQVPIVCEIESSCTTRPRPPSTVNTSNRYCASTSTKTKTIPTSTSSLAANSRRRASSHTNLSPRFLKVPLGQGKVREMAAYFNDNKDFHPPMNMNKSRSTSALDDPKPCDKLSQAEQGHILKQLKEWSLYGSAGKDYDKPDKSGGKTSCDCPCCGHCRGKAMLEPAEREPRQAVATFKCYDSCQDDEADSEEARQKPELSRYAACRRSVMCNNRQAHSVRQLKRNKQQKQHKAKPGAAHPRHHQHHHHHHCHCHQQQSRPQAPTSPPSTAKLLLSLASSSSRTKPSFSSNKRNSKSCPNCGDATDDCCSGSCSEAESCSSPGAAESSSTSCCAAAYCDTLEIHGNLRGGDNGDDDEDVDEDDADADADDVGGKEPCVKMPTTRPSCPTHR